MTNAERRLLVVNAISWIYDKIASLEYCEYDGAMTWHERKQEIETLRRHLVGLNMALVNLTQEDLGKEL